MQTYCHCICLRVVSHTDSVSIATLYTRQMGMVATAVHLGKSAEGRRRRAMLMPLSLIEAVYTPSRRGNLASLSDIIMSPGGMPGAGPVRQLVSAFLAEFLCAVLREGQPDIHLYDFVSDAVKSLSVASRTVLANFHLHFIFHLGSLLGIAPDMATYRKGWCFDMREGIFSPSPPSHRDYIDGSGTAFIDALSRARIRSLGLIKLNRDQRNMILDTMLAYYSMHYMPVTRLTSLQIVRDLLQ